MSTARTRRSSQPPAPRRPSRRPIGRHSNGMLMTPEEFDRRADFDGRHTYELIHGVLIVSPPPGRAERGPNDRLAQLLLNYKDDHPHGHVLDDTFSEETFACGETRRRVDRAIWAGLGREPEPDKDPPTIAIEIVSNRRRDRVRDYEEKRREYLAAGVREYWVIDRFRRIMTVYRKEPAEPAESVLKEDEVYATPLLPGFELPLSRIFRAADKWTAAKRSKKPADTPPAPEQPGEAGGIPPERG
ncbi:hypothetical protein OJF2_08180 [Aquisphaera giovannonii]|uniref:Putative restriction endonuclease domain-containing protein n=1 Tax=Aquisphaera giovannonii TaxID=406548 RepID=A0A5B9VVT3_9BACT|nr:Uma2 family endonuclease [Aquisphaera giovannonii]QEH32348.1 hypothetical protein OJF2_08180 [Aquisphaera giovannonii]